MASGYARQYIVWTRPQVAFLFEQIPDCEVICSQFPVGTNKQFGSLAIVRFLRSAWQIRRRRPSVTIDLIGDVRDRFFGRLAGGARHLHIGWTKAHPFSRLIRNPLGTGKPIVTIPASIPNVYDAHRAMLGALMPESKCINVHSAKRRPDASPRRSFRVGMHPFASQMCKRWPQENWRNLVSELLRDMNVEIVGFGAPSERGELEALFSGFGPRVTLATDSISNFAHRTAQLDVMIGLDSFSVHMAASCGVRSITINAGNPPDLWAPPGGVTLASSGGCAVYPCFNVPRCEGTERQYRCVKSITVRQVLDAVRLETESNVQW